MASYQQSTVNPAYFEVPTFEAPTEFLFRVAREKQQDFDRGINAVGQQYNTMASLPVSSQYGLSRRDAFMQEANDKLRKIAGADFSLAENRAAASNIYKPLTSDQYILHDLAETKKGQQQISLMDRLQTSKNEADRNQYWDTGRQYVNNSVRNLQNAKTPEDLMSAQVRDYVPYVDIVDKWNKAAKDLGIGISLDHVNGGYIVTDKNGNPAHMSFNLFAQSQLGTKEREVLRVMGQVEADNRLAIETVRHGGDKEAAKAALASEAIKERFTDYTEQLNDNQKIIEPIQRKLDETYAKYGDKIPEAVAAEILKLEDRKKQIEDTNDALMKRLRNIGYEKVQDNWIQNDNYKTTFDYYKNDLSQPYAETATKNMANSWAAGIASATAGMKLTADPNYAKAIDLQMKELELKGKLADATTKAEAKGAGEGSGSKKEKDDLINVPLQLDNNPFGRQSMSAYDYYKQTKQALRNGLFSYGSDFIQDAGTELSADFLTFLTESLKSGASTESPMGKSVFSLVDRPEFKDDLEKIKEMNQKGQLAHGITSYSDLFQDLLIRAKQLTEDKIKNLPEDTDSLPTLKSLGEEVDEHLKWYRVFKDDEKKINQKVLSNEKYTPFVDPQTKDLMSKEDYTRKITSEFVRNHNSVLAQDDRAKNGFGTKEEFDKFVQDKWSELGLPSSPSNNTADFVFDGISSTYDKMRKSFDKDFEEYIKVEKPSFMSKLPVQNGQIGFVYPIQEWQLRKNPDDASREVGDTILRRAFQGVQTDVTKILNTDQLGDSKAVQNVVDYVADQIKSDATADMGRVFTTQVGADGKSPSVIFRPSVEFLKDFASKGNPLDNSTLQKIAKYGIEIAADIPEVEKYKPSLVGRLIDIDKKYVVLPELKDLGFSASVEKQTNGRGYKIYLDYKTIDANGNEKVETHKDLYPDVFIPEQRLDMLAKGTVRDILTQYINYTRTKKEIEKQKVPETYYTRDQLKTMQSAR